LLFQAVSRGDIDFCIFRYCKSEISDIQKSRNKTKILRKTFDNIKSKSEKNERERERKKERERENAKIGLLHPLDGVTNPMYKLLHFVTTKYFFAKRRRH
jgi:hypothetical protein